MKITVTSGSYNGVLKMEGLPFTVKTQGALAVGYYAGWNLGSKYGLTLWTYSNQTFCYIFYNNSGTTNPAQLDNGNRNGCYSNDYFRRFLLHILRNKKMALTKETKTDKIETVAVNSGNHYVLQVRKAIQVLEDGNLLSQNFHRYVLNPDADTSTITDPVVLVQFNAVMTDEVKTNYQTFLSSQSETE